MKGEQTLYDNVKEVQMASLETIEALPFHLDMVAGTLSKPRFAEYLVQDLLYLRVLEPLLLQLSRLANSKEDEAFLRTIAKATLVAEGLTRKELLEQLNEVSSSDARMLPYCSHYLSHLVASISFGWLAGLAAVLPCFSLYSLLGARLVLAEENPYARWLANYTDPLFASQTATLWQMAEAAYQQADSGQRADAALAFTTSAKHEVMFFRGSDVE